MAEIREHDAMGCRACGREERASEGYPCAELRYLHLPHLHLPRRDALPRVRRQGRRRRRERRRPSPAPPSRPSSPSRPSASEQVSQLVLGETADRARASRRTGGGSAPTSTGTSAGSTPATAPRRTTRAAEPGGGRRRLEPRAPRSRVGDERVRLPLRARVGARGRGRSACPTAGAGSVAEGAVATADEAVAAARATAARALGARALRRRAVRVGRGHARTGWTARAWCRPPSWRAASRSRATRPSRRTAARRCRSTGRPPGRSAVLPRRDHARHHPRRVRRRGGHAGALDRRRRRGAAGVRGCRAAGRRRSASGSWRCGGWRPGDRASSCSSTSTAPSSSPPAPGAARSSPRWPTRCGTPPPSRASGSTARPIRRSWRRCWRRPGQPEPRESARVRALCERYVGYLARELERPDRADHPHAGRARPARPARGGARRGPRPAHRQPRRGRRAQAALGRDRARAVPGRRLRFGRGAPARPAADRGPPGRAASSAGCRSGAEVVIIGDTPADIACGAGIDARALGVATGAYSVADLAACGPHAVFEDLSRTDAVLEAILR